VDAATKAGLLDLLDGATDAGWAFRRACAELELGEVRAYRWLERRRDGELADRRPGSALHGLLDDEVAEIVALYHEWGEVDRSHRKLAHRGSYLGRVWVSPSSVRRVLAAQGLHLRPLPRPGRSVRKPFPDWVEYRPNAIWIYDTTHFPRARVAVTAIEDLVSRKWIAEIVSAEETSTQVQVVFTDALAAEGLLPLVEARQDGLVDPAVDDERRPILLAMSDNGPQMTSGSTREFMALCAIHQHFGRPGTPTDQAWIESLVGPSRPRTRTCSPSAIPPCCATSWPSSGPTTTRSACTPASATSRPTTSTRAAGRRSARPAKRGSRPPASAGLPTIASNVNPKPIGDPAMLTDSSRISIENSDTGHLRRERVYPVGGLRRLSSLKAPRGSRR
jgi:putative transposase